MCRSCGLSTQIEEWPALAASGQKLEQISQLKFAQSFGQIVGHRGLSLLAGLDILLANGNQLSLGGHQLDPRFVFSFDDARVNLPLDVADHGRLETLGDRLVRIDEGFQQVIALLLRGDLAQIGADFAPGAADLVAADAGEFRALDEDLPAALGIAPFQTVAVGGQRVLLSWRAW
jgi:hypothetical protein